MQISLDSERLMGVILKIALVFVIYRFQNIFQIQFILFLLSKSKISETLNEVFILWVFAPLACVCETSLTTAVYST